MNSVNKPIIFAAIGIGAVGVLSAWSQGKGITRIVLGTSLLMLILAVFDLVAGPFSGVLSSIAIVALVWAILTEGVPLLQQLGGAVPKQTGGTATDKTP